MLPYMDGLAFREAQLSSPFSDIPVVVITAVDVTKASADALRAMHIFYKPLDIPGLLKAVAELCPSGAA
jgi:CheY-like chemotaxis protein